MTVNSVTTGESRIQAYNFLFAVIFCLLGYLLPFTASWFRPAACLAGSLYTILNTRFFYFMVGALEKGQATKAMAVLGGFAKLPILFVLVYLAYSLGQEVLWSSLIGLFVFLPSALVYGLRPSK